ncbi:MAG: rhomboid family intramembrane serine protease [Nanoarchaeota archaeon]|nr:rhomboid family intramembrane serine protease [Nanoarchaeota archaeon]
MKIKNAFLTLIIINIIAFILQQTIPGFTEAFMLLSKDIFVRPWILLTSMFLHGNSSHLIFNMYALFIFGPLIEQRIGSKRFITIYIISGLAASFVSSFFYPAALGASGAIMGILALVIIFLPHLKVLFLFFIPMTMRTAGIIFAIIDLLGALGIGIPGIANIAHLVGLGCGLVYGVHIYKKKKAFNREFTANSGKKGKNMELSQDKINEYLKYGRL